MLVVDDMLEAVVEHDLPHELMAFLHKADGQGLLVLLLLPDVVGEVVAAPEGVVVLLLGHNLVVQISLDLGLKFVLHEYAEKVKILEHDIGLIEVENAKSFLLGEFEYQSLHFNDKEMIEILQLHSSQQVQPDHIHYIPLSFCIFHF